MPAYAVVAVVLLSAEVAAAWLAGHRPVGVGWLFFFWVLFVWRVTELSRHDWRAYLERGLRLAVAFSALAGAWFAVAPHFGLEVSTAVVVVDLIFAAAMGWLVGGLRELRDQEKVFRRRG
ncbi:MAG: hypothetical protein ACPLRW_08885 [Moorellales bacterium]